MLQRNCVLTVILAGLLIVFVIPQQSTGAHQEKKPLTNTDIITMTKAGLTDETIILAIKQAPSNFDTSVEALIQLKNQGVSSKVLDTMLQSGRPIGTPKQPSEDSNLATGGDPNKAMDSNDIQLVDGDRRIQMKRGQTSARMNTNMLIVVNPFSKSRGKTTLSGNHAQIRITNTSPVFELKIPSDVHSSEFVTLVQLKAKSDRREINTSKAGFTGVSFGFEKKDIIPITIKDPSNQDTHHTIKIVNPIPPGEYALVIAGGLFYDFGVDGSK